jgi:predicted translation initiation factor SUI1
MLDMVRLSRGQEPRIIARRQFPLRDGSYTALAPGDPSNVHKKQLPRAAQVRVGRETQGRAGKGVTVITGLPLAALELEQLAGELKRRCGSGGTVRNGVIEIQGEHRDRIVRELVRLGYDAKRSGG